MPSWPGEGELYLIARVSS